jgi:hypothetical protein
MPEIKAVYNALAEDTTPDPQADFVQTYDTSAADAKKVKPHNIYKMVTQKGADIASAGTVTFGDGAFFHITGTTTITAFAFTNDFAGRKVDVEFTGILTLTHNATSLILPTAANITTAAGDTATFVSEGSGNFRCLDYVRANGQALAGGSSGLTMGTTTSDGGSDTLLKTSSTGKVNNATGLTQASGNQLIVTSQSATDVPAIMKGAASQSGNLAEFRDNANVLLSYFRANGYEWYSNTYLGLNNGGGGYNTALAHGGNVVAYVLANRFSVLALNYSFDTPAQITANQNNYSITYNNTVHRLSSDASRDITGMVQNTSAATGGDYKTLINVGSNPIVLKHENASSTAANRFNCTTGFDITLLPSEAADCFYDSTTARWRVYRKDSIVLDTHGADIASAGTINLDTATGGVVDVTGTTTITAVTLTEGKIRVVRFTGALTLTHGASLLLPGAANITTVAGDYATFIGYSGGVVRCSDYVPVGVTGTGKQVRDTAPTLAGLLLAAGTTSVAPQKFTSGTNLTTAAAGAQEFDGVNYYSTIDTTSGRGAIPVEQYFHLTAAGGTISTIANFFGATSNISLVANAYYFIDIYCWFLNTTAGTVTWTFTNSAAPTSQNIEYEMSPLTGIAAPAGSAAANLCGQIYNDATAAKALTTTGTLTTAVNHFARFRIYLQNGTGTSLKIQATKLVGGTITPGINSYWFARRISPNNIGTFAA